MTVSESFRLIDKKMGDMDLRSIPAVRVAFWKYFKLGPGWLILENPEGLCGVSGDGSRM